MKFRFIDTKENTPAKNMAIDEALLDSKMPVLRFYRWKPAGLSLGYFQRIENIDISECQKQDVDVVRRLTGGNAVLHDKELTYSFIIDEDRMPDSVIESYRYISSALVSGLKDLGIKAEMNEDVEKKEKSDICFNDSSWYEIVVNRKKIIGSAQTRRKKKLLQHGAILLDIDTDKYCNLFNNIDEQTKRNLRNRITSVNEEIDESCDYKRLSKVMKKAFKETLDIEFEDSKLTKKEMKRAKRLAEEKYSDKKWNQKK